MVKELNFGDQFSRYLWWIDDMVQSGVLELREDETIHYLGETEDSFLLYVADRVLDKPKRPVVYTKVISCPKAKVMVQKGGES